jgi:hypothetical protein
MRYVAYDELGTTPNVIVDGSRSSATRLVLSHWPHSGTPAALKDDLSAQIAFRYLDQPAFHVEAEAVSNNHFDEDGLVSVYVLTAPEAARADRDRLVDVAAAGDFGTYRHRDSARAVFVLAAYADPALSPLGGDLFRRAYSEQAAALYRELLPLLPQVLDDLPRFRRHWEAEDEVLEVSEGAVASGTIRIEERPDLDLAVVTVPEGWPGRHVHRFAQGRDAACHPMAIHNATRRFRILLVQGRRSEVQYRYESWVQYVSVRPLPRVDLEPLARRLNEREGDGQWVFDGVDAITPRLRFEGRASRTPPDQVRSELEAFLATAPAGWDPYDPA